MGPVDPAAVTLTALPLHELDAQIATAVPELGSGTGWERPYVPVLTLTAGPCPAGEIEEAARHAFALLVVDGLLVREIVVGATVTSELLGPGDLVAARRGTDELLSLSATWVASAPTRLAILDERLEPVITRWPEIATELLGRAARQTARMTTERAVTQLPRVEDRLVALFWLLAERWGRMGTAGLIVPLSLTHETLGRLVGAQRPTVSLALKQLASDGAVTRRSDGAWVVRQDSAARLEAPGEVPARPAEAVLVQLSPDTAPNGAGARRGISTEDIRKLRERVAALSVEFEAWTATVQLTLSRSQAAREAVLDVSQRHRRRDGHRPPSGGSRR
jgi:CRP-like cAMP-binding protein